MSDPLALQYHLVLDHEAVAIDPGMTLGRHPDNDLVVAGDAVADFHVRIDVTAQGPIAVPLGGASCTLNGRALSAPAGVMPGDRLLLGTTLVVFGATSNGPPAAVDWRLCRPGEPGGVPIRGSVQVGRDGASDVHLPDEHVSRHHARLCLLDGAVWIVDLASANGTFINGEQVVGARRLFHGDEVRFDRNVFRLLGRGDTPGL